MAERLPSTCTGVVVRFGDTTALAGVDLSCDRASSWP